MSSKVFISSTVYDLLDVRAELASFLTELGLEPVMSDVATSDFLVVPNANSIETCLINVDACDFFVCILCQRYGPRLGEVGFDDISATHLEYRRAKEKKIPILFYVRDRLESDHAIWKRQGCGKDAKLAWVRSPADLGLLELMDEHRKLDAEKATSNWFATFRTSAELKEMVRNHLRLPATKSSLERAINEGRVPLIRIDAELRKQWWGGPWKMSFALTWRNVGNVPGYRLLLCEIDPENHAVPVMNEVPILGCGQEISIYPTVDQAGEDLSIVERSHQFLLETQIPGGIKIHDEFEFSATVDPRPDTRSVSRRALHRSRKFIITDDVQPLFEIVGQ
ncbi:MAG: DUF4062 domain-containing protein [Verrucomicrobia bacterium]|nr:DUF4062 domain-containing protein [Verrucomicrobiota bacterium]